MIVDDSAFTDMFEKRNIEELGLTEYIRKYYRTKNYNFQLLLNVPLFSTEPKSETYINNKVEPIIESMLDFNNKKMDS